ncbi:MULTISPECIES: peptide ABC transporter substrate-binding protein [Streptococcus]|uniref:peptide ABC transporter substrate-binding protein n=1 Tax=Streptococcus sp. UMB0029 TaxID=2069308 RepID=UPI000C7FA89F|nr:MULTISPECIES: peptide ABC transporter substrate-binding protein [Streptococcus]MDK7323102.1 peptide ABC transporter substrate-binding protein [Streptococcus mitis]PMC00252.1 peptide ABC transporter ATP-binding protein [Streptococcus sp. UMB0029]
MKKRVFLAAGVAVLSAAVLAACSSGNGNKEATKPVTYAYVFSSDPASLDYTVAGQKSTKQITGNVIDGLLENDQYGNLVPSVAEDWTVSKDGLTYTYKIRKGIKWYTNEGEEYGEVKAQDFVTGLKHAADKKSEGLYLVQDSIKGLDDYVNGKTTDFSTVGVKATDDYTVVYTLNHPESFWNSKTTMGVLAPVSEDFLASKGDDFGKATDITSILYNGAYLLTGLTSKSSIEMTKNQNYWDKQNVFIDDIKLSFFDGQDADSLGRGFDEGNYPAAPLFKNSANYERLKEKYKDNIIYSQQQGTTFYISTNIDRVSYNHTAKTSDAEKTSTKKALLNKDFRQALAFATDRKAGISQVYGDEVAPRKLRTSLTPPTFVQVGEQSFGQVAKAELDKLDGVWKDVSLDDAQDSLHNVDKAKAKLEAAKKTLQADGVQFPIHLDIPVSSTRPQFVRQYQSYKQSIEEALGSDNVIVDIQQVSDDELASMTVLATSNTNTDWDINANSGWGPDYADPSTYLDIFDPTSGPNLLGSLGVVPGKDSSAIKAVGLDKFKELITDANSEKTDLEKRYSKYAKAQAWLTDSALVIPAQSDGAQMLVTKKVPGTGADGWVGDKTGELSYKYLKIQDKIVTTKEMDEFRKKFAEEKAKSNADYQKNLERHIQD